MWDWQRGGFGTLCGVILFDLDSAGVMESKPANL
jgi:hypothetical protein